MKIFKNPIFTFIIGVIVASSIGVVASTILASNITYDNTTSHLKDSNNQDVTTVQGAIDVLYDRTVNTTYEISMTFDVGHKASVFPYSACNSKYKYFSFHMSSSSISDCYIKKWNTSDYLTLNTDYLISEDYKRIEVGTIDNWCMAIMTCHN